MDKSIKNMKRENELLDAVKSSNISSVQRILSKCRSGKSSKLNLKIFQHSIQFFRYSFSKKNQSQFSR